MIPMIDYGHLRTEISKTRYAMAALFLKECKTIVEIGGSRYSSIDQFLPKVTDSPDSTRSIYVVGNDLSNAKFWYVNSSNTLEFHKSPVEQFDFYKCLQHATGKKGLCILGLELFPETKSSDPTQVVCDILEMFDYIVIDYVVENSMAYTQAMKLVSKMLVLDMHCLINLTSEWTYDRKYFMETAEVGDNPSSSFYKPRQFMVFEQ